MLKIASIVFAALCFSFNLTCAIGPDTKVDSAASLRQLYAPQEAVQKENCINDEHNQSEFSYQTPQWLLQSSFRYAPRTLKGIYNYLQLRSDKVTIPSFHRFILVGAPGTGKTTLARAIAELLGYSVVFVPASSLIGHYYNETSVNMRRLFQNILMSDIKTVVIIDELHKLFEHYKEDKSDHSQTAAAFWLLLDQLEKNHPNIVVIGTANDVSKLPPEIKSRFHGKVIHVPLAGKNQKLRSFKSIINNDSSVTLDKSVDDAFISQTILQNKNCSLRDVQLLIDLAKIYSLAKKLTQGSRIVLKRVHFRQAIAKLNEESATLKESFIDKIYTPLKKWSLVISVITNLMSITRMTQEMTSSNRLLGYR